MPRDPDLHVGLDYRPALFSRSGIARSVRELAKALRGQVHLELFGHGWRRPIERAAEAAHALHGDELRRSRLPGRTLPTLARLGFDATRLSRRAPARARRVFHWTDYVYPPVRSDVPVTMTVHDVAFAHSAEWHGEAMTGVLRARFERALDRAAAVVCPSDATATMLRERFGRTPRTTTIPFGVDHVRRAADRARAVAARERAQSLLGTEDPFLVMLGTLEPRKNHASTLDALELLAARGRRVPLLILGSYGWGCDDVRARLERGMPFPCRWLEGLGDDEVYGFVETAHALLYPSSLEGFGFPPLEALELGTPAIVGDCAALSETCGDAAVVVDGRAPRAIAHAVERVLDTPEVGRSLLRAWQTRRARFTWNECARRHVELWRELIGAPQP